MIRWISLFVISAALFLLAACGDDGEDNGSDDSPAPDGTGVEVSSEEIAEALEGFVEALANADAQELGTYLSETCSEGQREAIAVSAALAAALFGGEVEYEVDADLLAFEVLDESHVAISQEQPEGAITIIVDGLPMPDEAESNQAPLTLAHEDGAWRITNCDDLVATG